MGKEGFPFSDDFRNELADRLYTHIGSGDPLPFLQRYIFGGASSHAGRIQSIIGRQPFLFYKEVVQYCEMSAWAEDPALILRLLNAFSPVVSYQDKIEQLVADGPFRCHPPGEPFKVCRVQRELPLFGRPRLRITTRDFDRSVGSGDLRVKRVLLIDGPKGSGKTYTHSFFSYLAAIQPLKVGVLYIDFKVEDILTQSINENVPVELLLMRKLESQVIQRRSELIRIRRQDPDFPEFEELDEAIMQSPFDFEQLPSEEQRPRWAAALARDFVKNVLTSVYKIPVWWVLILDNCGDAPKQVAQCVQSLVEIAAGTDPESAGVAEMGCLRMVLLGESTNLLPVRLYYPYVEREDLSTEQIGELQITNYFKLLFKSRRIKINDAHINNVVQECLAQTQALMTEKNLGEEHRLAILTSVVISQTLQIEQQAAQKRE